MQAAKVALAGGVVWAAGLVVLQPSIWVALLLVGPFILAPLALGLAWPGGPTAPARGRWRLALLLQLPCAAGLLMSFSLPAGREAALWTAPWLLFTALLAVLALLRVLEQWVRPAAELALSAGLAFTLVGGFWLTVSRLGVEVLGYVEPIPFLTAAHFLVAGLVVPVAAGLAARTLGDRFSAGLAGGSILGMPLVAIGITTKEQGIDWVNPIVVLVFVAIAIGVAGLNARLAIRKGPLAARGLWALSAASLPIGMALAALYALSPWTGYDITLDQMVATHAVINVFGFALPTLLAWTLAPSPQPGTGLRLLVPLLGDRPGAPEVHAGPRDLSRRAGDHEDRYDVVVGKEAAGKPVPDGPFVRAQQRILAFDLFPDRLVRVRLAHRIVQAGDLVAHDAPILPGLRIAFANRVTQVFDGPTADGWRAGFTQETTPGHPECGVETFAIEKDATGRVQFVITAWSRPNHPLTKLAAPVARRQQVRATKAALDRMAAALQAQR